MGGGVGVRAAVGAGQAVLGGHGPVELVADEDPVADQVPGPRRRPPRRPSRPSRARAGTSRSPATFISGEPYCSVPEPVRGRERGAGVVRLVAQRAVQLGRVADGLVDRQPQVGGVDRRGCRARPPPTARTPSAPAGPGARPARLPSPTPVPARGRTPSRGRPAVRGCACSRTRRGPRRSRSRGRRSRPAPAAAPCGCRRGPRRTPAPCTACSEAASAGPPSCASSRSCVRRAARHARPPARRTGRCRTPTPSCPSWAGSGASSTRRVVSGRLTCARATARDASRAPLSGSSRSPAAKPQQPSWTTRTPMPVVLSSTAPSRRVSWTVR